MISRLTHSILVLLAAIAIVSGQARGQISADTARGLVGKDVVLTFVNDSLSFEGGTTVILRGDFRMTDPTVFYPRIFRRGSAAIVDSSLVRFTDSTYSFRVTLAADVPIVPGDTLFLLAGEGLAGADSTTDLIFTNVFVNDAPGPEFTATIITESIGPRLPYVRFAVLDPGRPNPTKPGLTVTWGFRIDKASPVTFKIYNVVGQEVVVQELGMLNKGVYVNTFTPDIDFSSGMFLVRLITNSGDAFQVMHVLK